MDTNVLIIINLIDTNVLIIINLIDTNVLIIINLWTLSCSDAEKTRPRQDCLLWGGVLPAEGLWDWSPQHSNRERSTERWGGRNRSWSSSEGPLSVQTQRKLVTLHPYGVPQGSVQVYSFSGVWFAHLFLQQSGATQFFQKLLSPLPVGVANTCTLLCMWAQRLLPHQHKICPIGEQNSNHQWLITCYWVVLDDVTGSCFDYSKTFCLENSCTYQEVWQSKDKTK